MTFITIISILMYKNAYNFLQHCQIWKLKVSKAKCVRVAFNFFFLLFMLVACKNVIIIYITIYDSSITLHIIYTCINSSSLNRTTTAKDIQNRCVWSNDGDIFIDSYDRHRVCRKSPSSIFHTYVEEWSDWRDIIICHLFACVIWFPFFVSVIILLFIKKVFFLKSERMDTKVNDFVLDNAIILHLVIILATSWLFFMKYKWRMCKIDASLFETTIDGNKVRMLRTSSQMQTN